MISKIILIPKNINVKKVSKIILNQLSGNFIVYYSINFMNLFKDSNSNTLVYLPKFLKFLKISNFFFNELKLKVKVPIILLASS